MYSVCPLDCNLTQPRAACCVLQTSFQNKLSLHSFPMGKDGEERRLVGRSSWNVNVYCMRATSCEDTLGYFEERRLGLRFFP